MIRKILVANRGEIARRVMRTCRELGIATVAVYSEPDQKASFVAEADEAVALGGASPADSYLRIDAVVNAALASGAEAVHPGYGFLSENAAFARACADASLTFIGPPVAAIETMGSKLAARDLMARCGVPTLPGADLSGVEGDDVFATAERVGWPILVKASFGGGGRGMRVVREPADLVDAVAAARREAASAFGNDTVFLERYVDEPRHVEIQIFGDALGNLVHLFERECSIQRRHQKIIEESPSPAVTPALRQAMGDAAVAAGRAIDYVGAGTVEFLLTPEGEFFFLEVNTRLQVEHPVTEAVTGLDLVALQIAVAEGQPLPAEVVRATQTGHAVEARLYAEDPLNHYLPVTGTLRCFDVPCEGGIRVDSGFVAGDEVSINYDPMLAKVIAYAPTRSEAVRKLSAALRRSLVHGVRTNRELLVGVLDHPEFVEGRIDTHFLDRHPPAELAQGLSDPRERNLYALAAALAEQAANRAGAKVWVDAPSGWRNNPTLLVTRTYLTDDGPVRVGYRLGRDQVVEVDGMVPAAVALGLLTPTRVELIVEGVLRVFTVALDGLTAYVDSRRGSLVLQREPRFPDAEAEPAAGSLVAPMPGTVVRVDVTKGDDVVAGQTLLILEAMKMEHMVVAPGPGVVASLNVKTRQTVDAGQLLAVIEEVGLQ